MIQKFSGVSGSGVNMWTKYPNGICQSVPEGRQIFKKECTAAAIYDSCALKFLTSDLKVYGTGRGAAWHPTVGIHLLRGELLVWLYGVTLLDALFTTRELLSNDSYEAVLRGTHSNLPSPEYDISPSLSPHLCVSVSSHCLSLSLSENSNQLHRLKVPPSDEALKLSCDKDPLLCHGRAICYTDYTPRHSKLSLEGIIVGSTKWKKIHNERLEGQQERPFPEDLESRPYYLSQEGPADGEIFFQVTIRSSSKKKELNKVLVCGYRVANHKEGIFGHIEYRVDLNAWGEEAKKDSRGGAEGGGRAGYLPSDNRIVWTNHTKESAYCHLLKDLPPGRHVIGLESKEKKRTGLTHVITWSSWADKEIPH
jgi:hypothetical protein